MAEGTGTNIGKAYIQIMPSADGIKGKLESLFGEEGVKAGKGFAGKFSGALGTLGKGVGVAVGALGAGAAAAGGAFAAAAGNVAQYGDNIEKMSQKMGMSFQAYQEWGAIMEHSGSDINAVRTSMVTLAKQAGENSDAFQKLGISQQEVASLSQEELFSRVISGLQNMGEGLERTEVATKLLGRGAKELGPLLNTSAEETEKMRQRVHELGGVMSDEAVKASARFQDSLQDMRTAISGVGRNLLAELLPGLSGIMDGIGDIFAGRKGTGKFERGVDQLINAAEKILPKAMKIGGEILDKLGTAILDNAPRLFKLGGDLFMQLVRGLLDKLPDIIPAAVGIVQALTDTLTENLPELIPLGVRAILEFIDGLIQNLPTLIECALEILVALAQGIANAMPVIVEMAPQIMYHLAEAIITLLPVILETGIIILATLLEGLGRALDDLTYMGADAVGRFVDGVKSWFGDVFASGADLLDLFIQGIKSRVGRLIDTVKDLAQTVRDYIGFSEPKVGPLSDFHTYGPDMMELYAAGIRSRAGLVTGALEDSLELGEQLVQFPAQRYAAAGGKVQAPAQAQSPAGSTAPRMQTVILQLDGVQFARLVHQVYDDEDQRIGVRLAKGVL